MERRGLLSDVLDLAVAQDADRARALLDRTDPFEDALDGYVTFLAARPEEVARPVPEHVADPTTVLLATAVDVLAGAVDPGHDALASLAVLPALAAATDPACPAAAFARYTATEAALASARLDVARTVLDSSGPPHELWPGHAYAGVMRACAARVEVFSGNVTGALALLADPPPPGLAGDLVRATHALAAGNAADVATMRALVAEVQAADVQPTDRLGRGIHLLLAFGVIALGDTAGAVRHLLRAGGGADLDMLTIIDRALGHELLVAAAVDEGDLESALAWVDRALPLADHRAAAPTVARLRSRAALLAGDAAAAEAHAVRAVALAGAEGRSVEKAEGEIVLARARIARQDVPGATRDLRAVVAESDRTGHLAVRHAATRELRPVRRRLPPVTGAGWQSLSARERDVADLILDGAANAEIAARLHLSPATVRAHASRVLTAYGVATRIGLLAQAHAEPGDPVVPTDLTPRQGDVARLVAAGRSNGDIAGALGISVKSVEKHVSDVLVRWQVTSRFELAHRWWQLQAA